MTIAACPKCREEITLPSHASAQARVRCPLCQDEYQLSAVLEKMPPPLVVIDDPAASSAAASAGATSAQPGDSAIHAFAAATGDAPASKEATSTFDFQEQSAPSAKTATKPGTGARPRRRKNPKKPAIEVLKIVGGGAVGIIAAILIMWWVIGKDPFKLAPKIASFAPFLVPDDLAKGKTKEELEDKQDGKKQNSQNLGAPATGPSNGEPKDRSFSQAMDPTILPFDNKETQSEVPDQLIQDGQSKIGKTDLIDNGPIQDQRKDSKAEAKDAPKSDTSPNQEPAKSNEFVGIRNAPSYTPDQFKDAVAESRATLDAWQGADSANSDNLEMKCYAALAAVGHMVSCIDQTDQRFREALQETDSMLAQLARRSLALPRISKRAVKWLEQTDRASDGVVLAGRVTSQIRQGKLVESRIELLSDPDTVIPLMTPGDPSKLFKLGSRVLIFSAIVDDPQKDLGGYEGVASRVIYGGWVKVIPN